MSTRAHVGKVVDEINGNKRVEWIYVHFAPSLKLLQEHYNTIDKVNELLSLGDASYLEPSIEAPRGHSFTNPVEGYSVFYGRDRGEDKTDSKTTFMRKFLSGNCAYLFDPNTGTWEEYLGGRSSKERYESGRNLKPYKSLFSE